MSLRRKELDSARCVTPNCTEEHGKLFIHARCHPDATFGAWYHAGELRLTCGVCGGPVAEFAIAGELAQVASDADPLTGTTYGELGR